MRVGRPPRSRVVLKVDDLLELVGIGVVCYAIACLAGVAWALLAAGLFLIALAELVHPNTVARLPLPRRPRPVRAYYNASAAVTRWRDRRSRRRVVRRAARRARSGEFGDDE